MGDEQKKNYMKCICQKGTLIKIIDSGDKYSLFSCNSCGIIQSAPFPSKDDYDKFYDGFLFRIPKNVNSRKRKINNDVSKIVVDIKKIIKKDLSKLKLLDVGGGLGYYSNAFDGEGLDVTLLEMDKQACQYAVNNFKNLKVENKNIFEYEGAESDVIFCNQVIEHSDNPVKLLDKLNSLLSPEGLLIIATPNRSCKEFLFRPFWLYSYLKPYLSNYNFISVLFNFLRKPWICCDPPRHLFSFNKKNISYLHNLAGLKVKEVKNEYSIQQYYSLKKYNDFSIKSIRSFLKIIFHLLVWIFSLLLMLFDLGDKWGNNLVVFSVKK